MKSEIWDQVKRIKTVKLYPGLSTTDKSDVVGGIQIVYELKNGEDYENGTYGIKCTNYEVEPSILELKDNEYINNIIGTGTTYIKSLTLETNFYRKIKQGQKQKEENQKGIGE